MLSRQGWALNDWWYNINRYYTRERNWYVSNYRIFLGQAQSFITKQSGLHRLIQHQLQWLRHYHQTQDRLHHGDLNLIALEWAGTFATSLQWRNSHEVNQSSACTLMSSIAWASLEKSGACLFTACSTSCASVSTIIRCLQFSSKCIIHIQGMPSPGSHNLTFWISGNNAPSSMLLARTWGPSTLNLMMSCRRWTQWSIKLQDWQNTEPVYIQ